MLLLKASIHTEQESCNYKSSKILNLGIDKHKAKMQSKKT